MSNQLLFATSNPHKLEEVRSILDSSFIIDGLDSLEFEGEIPETQDTIEGNAIQKVNFISQFTAAAVFAEDTGLIVPQLGGAPGVYSARYAGEQKSDQDNMAKLLEALDNQSYDRKAYFRTVIAFRDPEGEISTFTGEAHGRISTESKGDKGFGYDPIFIPDGYDQTFAELGEDIKNRISHRGKALGRFIDFLKQKGTG